mmetsp:Transcript_8397/g.20657  ORF Transcript_8397/g.20657 Transcript_8397/m.20657 type:complete len:202 (+) Transcript_8397:442-1047(+)
MRSACAYMAAYPMGLLYTERQCDRSAEAGSPPASQPRHPSGLFFQQGGLNEHVHGQRAQNHEVRITRCVHACEQNQCVPNCIICPPLCRSIRWRNSSYLVQRLDQIDIIFAACELSFRPLGEPATPEIPRELPQAGFHCNLHLCPSKISFSSLHGIPQLCPCLLLLAKAMLSSSSILCWSPNFMSKRSCDLRRKRAPRRVF